MTKLFLMTIVLISIFSQSSFARMDPSRPHLTPENCWGECEQESKSRLDCKVVSPSVCRAYTIACVGGYLLEIDGQYLNSFMFSNNTNAKALCESHKLSIERTLAIIENN